MINLDNYRRMEDLEQLDTLVKSHAKKAGISQKDAVKALKKLKKGGMMGQIAPQLQESFMKMDPTMTPRDKLRQKLNSARTKRTSKNTKSHNYEKQKEEAEERKIIEEQKKQDEEQKKKRTIRNHKKRIKELKKKLGVVSEDLYFDCLHILSLNTDKKLTIGEKNRCNNIIELYSQQNKFSNQINMDDDLDDLLN